MTRGMPQEVDLHWVVLAEGIVALPLKQPTCVETLYLPALAGEQRPNVKQAGTVALFKGGGFSSVVVPVVIGIRVDSGPRICRPISTLAGLLCDELYIKL